MITKAVHYRSTSVRAIKKSARPARAHEAAPTPARLPIETPIGTFVAHYGPAGLCGMDFPARSGSGTRGTDRSGVDREIAGWHETTTRAIQNALAGRAPETLPPMDLSAGTEFQQSVWRAMLAIGYGETKSYGEIARAIERPLAVRAVGAACGANPIPVLIPCHRVLAANKMIGGFSSGLDWKRKLLAIESPGLFD